MTATIVRVKRRLDDDPVEALLLSFKRKKSEEGTSEQALLRLAATVDKKEDLAATKTLLKSAETLKDTYKLHTPDIKGRQRRENEKLRKQSRFKILSLNRTENSEAGSSTEGSVVTIVDVGAEVDDQALPSHEPKYVYDLYSTDFCTDETDVDDGYLEILHSVQPFTTEMQYRGSEDSDEIDPCDEDSNDEDYYKNDYPDSDNSVTEDDMRLVDMLHRVGIDKGEELSSDGEDELITSMDYDDKPQNYEAYKKRILREWQEEENTKRESIRDEYDREISLVETDSSSYEDLYS